MNNKYPKISICIPNYNNSKYLKNCIQSAVDQNYPNKEIIFVDDNSTDNSLEIAEKYSDTIRIFKNESNLGQPKNTNKSIELSNGEFIVILHSDDQLLPDFCIKLSNLLIKYPSVGMAVGERIETDENNFYSHIVPFYNNDYVINGEKQAKVFMFTSFLPCQVLFRRKLFFDIGKINERHIVNLDGLLWFTMSLKSDLAYIQDEVCIYRKHPNNTTSMYNKQINHMMEYYTTLLEMFKLAEDNNYLKQFFIDAEKRVALLTLRYCQDVIRNEEYNLAKKYLILSTVFDEDIKDSKIYKIIEQTLKSNKINRFDLFQKLIKDIPIQRKDSYSPPIGSKILKRK